jgi:dihydrofolate reductase
MSKLRVHCFSLSLDGYGAGPNQSLENPLGQGAMALHQWFFPMRVFQEIVLGKSGGTTGTDNDFAVRGIENVGTWILGRNMFEPVRGQWPDENWKGWWGDNPPYHCDVFVLTHHPRKSFAMEGGTTFHFVTDGIRSALEKAKAAAKGKDVRLGGGVSTIRQYLKAKLVDEMHLAVSPILLGEGEHLWSGLDLPKLGYEQKRYVPTERAAHYVFGKR